MTSPLVLAQVLVVLTLVLSGALKLRDIQASRDAFRSLRMPRWLAESPTAAVLPWAELVLALGILLLSGWAGVVAAVLALLLFCCYLVVVARALRFDEPVSCGCFGKLGLGTVSRVTLVRNLVLVSVAVLAVQQARAGESLLTQLLGLSRHDLGWLLGALGAALLAGLVTHSNASAELPSSAAVDEEGEFLRQPIPFGQLRTPDGDLTTLQEMAGQSAVLLAFVNTTCGSCVQVLELLPSFDEENPEVSTRAVFHENHELTRPQAELGVPVLFDPEGSVARLFGVGNPAAVLLGADGLLAGGPVVGQDQVADFLDDIAGQLVEARQDQAAPADEAIA